MPPMDDLENLRSKVDDHDKSLMLMSKAVEDINKNLDRFVTSNEKLANDMTKHWHVQDKTMDKLEVILEKMTDGEARFRKIEERQVTGCPSFKNFMENRANELKRWEMLFDGMIKNTKQNADDIEAVEKIVSVHTEKISVANNRIADIEKWQERAVIALITNAFGVIGTLIAVIWGMVKH